ncbi:MAG: NADH-quinone oxidoreductase subunit M [Candidatus Omnitrophica bacterium]|nr:NADH-quinone oxidoreductase subunit M [Candidatus Omnitrophota bacterium]
MNLVSWILGAPALGMTLLLFVPRTQEAWVRRIAVAATTVSLALALILVGSYDRAAGGYQFVTEIPWVPQVGIAFHVGADGISVAMLLLHALCAWTGVLISYSIKERVKEYYLFYLTLITGVFGVFASLDLFFFYLFYEMAVIPMYPLIGIWGSDASNAYSKEYATMKLTLYLTSGAVLALLGLLVLYGGSGISTFSLPALEHHLALHPLPPELQRWIFPFLLIGFGVIAPLWPFHSWSPIGHAAAPSAVSMLHAGVLMKLGSYAIIRIAISLLPEGAAAWLPLVATVCIMNIIYGGLVAMAQQDAKFIIGYSSSSHMGYVLLGLSTLNIIGLNGAVYLMVAHGWMTALAFALIGFIYDQAHTRMLPDWGGLAKQLPFIATAVSFMAMASAGVPGFGNFVAELLIFVGAWEKYRWQTVAAVFGVVITATYLLRFVRSGFFGETLSRWDELRDATTPFQRLPFVALIVALLILGCWPNGLLPIIDTGSRALLQRIGASTMLAGGVLP